MQKLILSDVDGVLLDYNDAFRTYHNLPPIPDKDSVENFSHAFEVPLHIADEMVTEFNNSVAFKELKPLDTAVKYVTRLKDAGFNFHLITSCGSEEKVYESRKHNLEQLFPFDFENGDKLTCISYEDSKWRFLKEYQDTGLVWVEDSFNNYEIGVTLGLDSYLFPSPFHSVDHSERQCMDDWRMMYYRIKQVYGV